MHAEPQEQHRWLHRLVGEWTYEGESPAAVGSGTNRHTGTESVRSLGGVWVVCEATGETPGTGTSSSIMTLGYDPARGRFVGTFVGSMMTYLWIYDGQLDAGGTTLTLDNEGPSFTKEGEMGRYRDVVRFESDDHRTLTSLTQGDDGEWVEFMTMRYTRKR